jgi:hypothetical protein
MSLTEPTCNVKGMNSPIRGNFPRMGVQVPLGHVKSP